MSKYLIVSLHDYHPGSREAIQEQVNFLKAAGVPCVSILAVPRFHMGKLLGEDAEAVTYLDQCEEKGCDLVVHGYSHMTTDGLMTNWFWNRIYTNRESEFLDLSDGEARHRIEQGLQLWAKRGWKARGFVAPAWLMPKSQDALLRSMGFAYTNRLRSVTLLLKRRDVCAQSLCYSTRSALRRSVSVTWNHTLFNRLRKENLMRLSLHPDDLKYEPIKQQISEMLGLALAEGYEPITYAGYAAL
ncbi:MAG: DUF2334 domain-containing protein [Candidatus Methylacidiphilales bacterium]